MFHQSLLYNDVNYNIKYRYDIIFPKSTTRDVAIEKEFLGVGRTLSETEIIIESLLINLKNAYEVIIIILLIKIFLLYHYHYNLIIYILLIMNS